MANNQSLKYSDMFESNFIFPEVFITGELNADEIRDERLLVAYALTAWGNCMAGATPPKKFGEGMVVIGERLGIVVTPDNIEKYAVEKGYCK